MRLYQLGGDMKQLQKVIMREIMSPLLRRGGTMIATWLISTGGISENEIQTIVNAIMAAAFVAFDLVGSYLERKK